MATVGSRTDGFGAQFQTIIYGIIIIETQGQTYYHTPILSMEHNYDNDPNFLNKVEELIADLELSKPPQKEQSTLLQSITLTKAHEDIITDKFKADLELFDRIKTPGIMLEG